MLRLVSSYYARLIVNRMRREGLNVNQHLAHLNLDESQLFSQPRLSYALFNLLITEASRWLSDPSLGLYLARYSSPSTLGYLGTTALAQATLFDSLRIVAEFSRIQAGSVNIMMERKPDHLILSYHTDITLGDALIAHHEVYAASVQQLIQHICGCDFTQGHIHFQFDRPSYADEYSQAFNSPVAFDCDHTAVMIPARLLSVASPFKDPELASRGWAMCTEQVLQHTDILVEPTQASVKALLISSGGAIPTIRDIAMRLNCSSRTLARLLAQEGVSFRDLRNKVLTDRGKDLLAGSDLSVAAVASLLGYKDEAAFYRAFKRECGKTPAAYRHGAVDLTGADK